MHFWQHGWTDLAVAVISIIFMAGTLLWVGRRTLRKQQALRPRPAPTGSQVRLAQQMIIRTIAAANLPLEKWLKGTGDVRFRLWRYEGDVHLVERTVQPVWPPLPGTVVQIVCIVVQPDMENALRFTVDVKVPERGKIPVSVRVKVSSVAANGTLRATTAAEASEIIQWMQELDEVRPQA